VFKAMLTTNMRERASGRIELPDISLKTGRQACGWSRSSAVVNPNFKKCVWSRIWIQIPDPDQGGPKKKNISV
jgi:hypothetical protein